MAGVRSRAAFLLLTTVLAAGLLAVPALAQPAGNLQFPSLPNQPAPELGGPVTPAIDGPETPARPDLGVTISADDAGLSRTVLIILLLTVGSVAPGLLLLMTTFTRFVIVLGLAKNALAFQTVPPAQVLVGLSLFLTFFVMGPTLSEVNDKAIQPMLAGTVGTSEALQAGFTPLRSFMLAQTRESDLQMFVDLSGNRVANRQDVPANVLIPAFVISELRTAFVIGFVIFVPFLVIDLVVAAVLMSMGMVMLPPVFISLPLKLLLFILVDGWVLIIGSLVGSVQGVPI